MDEKIEELATKKYPHTSLLQREEEWAPLTSTGATVVTLESPGSISHGVATWGRTQDWSQKQ